MTNNLSKQIRNCFFLLLLVSCSDSDCKYNVVEDDLIPAGCVLTNSLNLSTGIDANGNVIIPGQSVTDPNWRVLNKPPLLLCDDNFLVETINGSAYVVNFGFSGPSDWVNQPTASTLAPVDLGTTSAFGCDNAENAQGEKVPYVFERSFCVLRDTHIDFDFSYKGDDQLRFELINNATDQILSSSTLYIYPDIPFHWIENNFPIDAGSYSIRGYLVNSSSVVLGFSMSGSISTTNGDLAISNNVQGCCENNTISILNVLESVCDQNFDSADVVGSGWIFKLKDAAGNVIDTKTSNINGNVFFSGLSDGTYTVETTPQSGFTVSSPVGGSITVTVANNMVKIISFYSCQ